MVLYLKESSWKRRISKYLGWGFTLKLWCFRADAESGIVILSMDESDKKDERWPKVSVSGLEADIAYFDARLSMLEDNASTTHQEAQTKAYKALESTLIGMLLKMRMQSGKGVRRNKNQTTDVDEG